jgi:mobilome CxxCx(11)CxxC protein
MRFSRVGNATPTSPRRVPIPDKVTGHWQTSTPNEGEDVDAPTRQALDPIEQMKLECQDRAFNAFATASIFERRALLLSRRLKFISFLGAVVPIVIGSAALSWGVGFTGLPILVVVGGGVGLLEVVLAVWSLSAGWVQAHAYAVSSSVGNQRLFRDYRSLAANSPTGTGEFRARLNVLTAVDDAREEQDSGQDISPAEKRYGMRAALRKFKRNCSACDVVPKGMRPSDCEVCGKYRRLSKL